MSLSISKAHTLMAKALDFRSIRQDMISSNIANADTPYYKPRDISFEDALSAKKAKIFNEKSDQLKMAKTDSNHLSSLKEKTSLKPTTFFRDGHMARNDANSVDIDVETTQMSKNSIMFNALVQAMKKDLSIYKSVIEASSKIS